VIHIGEHLAGRCLRFNPATANDIQRVLCHQPPKQISTVRAEVDVGPLEPLPGELSSCSA